MSTTQGDIRRWLNSAPKNATHMMVVCDTFEYDDFPVYCEGPEECERKYTQYKRGENMTKLMEVYDLSMDHEAQIAQPIVMNTTWKTKIQ